MKRTHLHFRFFKEIPGSKRYFWSPNFDSKPFGSVGSNRENRLEKALEEVNNAFKVLPKNKKEEAKQKISKIFKNILNEK